MKQQMSLAGWTEYSSTDAQRHAVFEQTKICRVFSFHAYILLCTEWYSWTMYECKGYQVWFLIFSPLSPLGSEVFCPCPPCSMIKCLPYKMMWWTTVIIRSVKLDYLVWYHSNKVMYIFLISPDDFFVSGCSLPLDDISWWPSLFKALQHCFPDGTPCLMPREVMSVIKQFKILWIPPLSKHCIAIIAIIIMYMQDWSSLKVGTF